MKNISTPNQIFVSYSRLDLELAEKLERRLTNEGFQVWRDLAKEEGGEDWWDQIKVAISASDTLVLNLSPNALKSETVMNEFNFARQVGTRVIPVIANDVDFLDSSLVPRSIRKMNCMDFRESASNHDLVWSKFVAQLHSSYERVLVVNESPSLDQPFQERPVIRDQILRHLLDETGYDPKQNCLVLDGNGGFGKTTIARAICRDKSIAQAFKDGILWITLGQTPDLISLIRDQIEFLTENRPGFSTLEPALSILHDLLNERDVLIVIDDVWQVSHAATLMQIGRQFSYLITSRLQHLAVSIHGMSILVDEMETEESVGLLNKFLNSSVDTVDKVRQLVNKLGNWPILLALSGAFLRELTNIENKSLDSSIQEMLSLLNQRGFTALDQTSEEGREKSIKVTLDLSLDRLNEWRERYLELCIFPDDVDIPFAAVQILWQGIAHLADVDLHRALREMNRLSLFSQYDPVTQTVRLHDVVRKCLTTYFPDGLTAFHVKLLEGWGNPLRLPDTYSWRYYVYHMVKAEYGDRVFTHVCNFRWIEAKLNATDVPSLVRDFDLASMALLPFDMTTLSLGEDNKVYLSPQAPVYWGDEATNKERQARHDTLWFIHSAILLAAHILEIDKTQLSGQLLGRLLSFYSINPTIAALLDAARANCKVPCLLPVLPSLEQAAGSLIRTIDLRQGSAKASHSIEAALSSDGNYVFVAGWTSNGQEVVEIWNTDTAKLDSEILGHERGTSELAASKDGRYLIVESQKHTLAVWNCITKQQIHTLIGHLAPVTTIDFSADGKYAVSGSTDRTARIWDIQTGELVRILEGHTDNIWKIILTPDMGQIITASQDHTVRVWEFSTGNLLHTLNGHEEAVTCVAIRHETIISASEDGTMKEWDLRNGNLLRTLNVGHGSITALLPIANHYLVSGSLDASLRLWNLDTGTVEKFLVGHNGPILSLTTTAKHGDNYFLSLSSDGTLKLWNLTPARKNSGQNYGWPVSAIDMASDGKRVVSGSRDGTITIVDLAENIEMHALKGHAGKVVAVKLFSNYQQMLSIGEDDKVKIWDLKARRVISEQKIGATSIEAVSWIDDNQVVVVTDGTIRETDGKTFTIKVPFPGEKTFRIYDLDLNKWTRVWNLPFELGTFPSLLSGGQRAVSVTGTVGNPLVILWNTSTGEVEHSTSSHLITTAAYSIPHDQEHILIVQGRKLVLWDIARNQTEETKVFHQGEINDLAMAGDGKYIVTVSDDRIVKIWDHFEDKLITQFSVDSPLTCCAISADNSMVAVGDQHGILHLLHFVNRNKL